MNRVPNNCCARLLAALPVFSAGRALAQSERDDLIKSVADAMTS